MALCRLRQPPCWLQAFLLVLGQCAGSDPYDMCENDIGALSLLQSKVIFNSDSLPHHHPVELKAASWGQSVLPEHHAQQNTKTNESKDTKTEVQQSSVWDAAFGAVASVAAPEGLQLSSLSREVRERHGMPREPIRDGSSNKHVALVVLLIVPIVVVGVGCHVMSTSSITMNSMQQEPPRTGRPDNFKYMKQEGGIMQEVLKQGEKMPRLQQGVLRQSGPPSQRPTPFWDRDQAQDNAPTVHDLRPANT